MQPTYDKIQHYTIDPTQKASLIAKLQTFFAKNDHIKTVYLYGSINRRNHIRDIDIDIIAMPKLTFKEQLNLNAQLELELNISTDLTQLTQMPQPLKNKIYKTGTKIK